LLSHLEELEAHFSFLYALRLISALQQTFMLFFGCKSCHLKIKQSECHPEPNKHNWYIFQIKITSVMMKISTATSSVKYNPLSNTMDYPSGV